MKEGDLPYWGYILSKSGATPEKLAGVLEKYSSLEELCGNREEYSKKLEVQSKNLTAQVKALKEEREEVSAAITAIRDRALAEVEITGQKTRDNLNALMVESEHYKKLQKESASLGEIINLAKAIKGQDPALWSRID